MCRARQANAVAESRFRFDKISRPVDGHQLCVLRRPDELGNRFVLRFRHNIDMRKRGDKKSSPRARSSLAQQGEKPSSFRQRLITQHPPANAFTDLSRAMKKRAIYAGTFDPPTIGHEWMFKRGALLFDELRVVVAANADKNPMFSVTERIDMILKSTESLANVDVASIDKEVLVEYARAKGFSHLLRGMRNVTDVSYEQEMRHINADIEPDIDTVFLMPPRHLSGVSSSMVKSWLYFTRGYEHASRYVPEHVFRLIQRKASPS